MESSPIQSPGALLPVIPVRTAAPYVGGKRKLAQRLAARISAVPHSIYAEVFVGMGGVFLRRDLRPTVEVINDWSEDVTTFFRILQRHYVPFMEMLRYQLTTRADFDRLLRTDPTTLTDLERSARFLYLQRAAFGGKVVGRNFGISYTTSARFDVTKLGPILEDLHERLAPVTIDRLPWAAFIDRWDRPETLFFLDPPYHGTEHYYGPGMFSEADFAALADRLARLRGRFIMSINDTPLIRDLFGRFTIEDETTSYTAGGGAKVAAVTELIISGGGA
ncbi:DNA adenine methylase [Sphingomonas cannabina]|uniref:DNA adenine methylase n=1 Tax=Sphingomonas cannabina TaxID=2899123 RepID=UPI001F46A566|nr:DNA adenine methylase [Sphingomonas cannabina]UIJ46940.1 DNA adenine methylase [Sphingomonas cannabina]